MANIAGEEHNEVLARKIVEELFNRGKRSVATEIFAPDLVDRGHEQVAGKEDGREGFAQFVTPLLETWPCSLIF